jgi:endoglucanase
MDTQAVAQATPARPAVLAAIAAYSSMRVSAVVHSVRTILIDRPGYEQCLPGGAVDPSAALPFLGGVNTAGYDFTVSIDGSFSVTGISPPAGQYQHFASQGANIFRIPFAWQLMTPTVGGTVSTSFLSTYDATVAAAMSSSTRPYVIVDLHSALMCPLASLRRAHAVHTDYARWNGGVIGQGGPSNAEYASLWSQLATHYKDNSKIIFGIMNEPHDLPSLQAWADSVQAAVDAIRAAGATSQYILLPGLLKVSDPAGGVDKLLFDVHKYLDSDQSGTHPECVMDNIPVLQTLYNWLQTNGRRALLSETGGGNTQSCFTDLNSELAFVKSHSDHFVGFTAWSAGAFDTSELPFPISCHRSAHTFAGYTLTLTPNSDGSDQPLWTNAIKPNLP